MTDQRDSAQIGNFEVEGENLVGQLVLAGRDSYVELHREQPFRTGIGADHILGSLNDQTRVSLLRCVSIRAENGQRDGRQHSRMEVLPHFALLGSQHLRPSDSRIRSATLFMEDSAALFYDFDAFGSALDADPIIQEIAARDTRGRPLPIGPSPQVAFFAGQLEILRVDTALGTFRAQHNPTLPFGGPRGVSISNEISIHLDFGQPIDFNSCIDRTQRMLAFLELVIGRQQVVRRQYIDIGDRDSPTSLRVHESHSFVRFADRHDDRLGPQPADLLLPAIERTAEFATVMAAWTARDGEFREARQRFHTSFVKGNRFAIDRLVASANMYDLLPPQAVPDDVTLPPDLLDAKQAARDLFTPLPASYERDSVLSALGRVGKASLKHKVRARAELVSTRASSVFPNLHDVLDEAVNCRNHFVHGSPSRIDYGTRSDLVPFLARSLEFVFAAADLIECGWDLRRFLAQGTTGSHPFGSYKAYYNGEQAELMRALPQT